MHTIYTHALLGLFQNCRTALIPVYMEIKDPFEKDKHGLIIMGLLALNKSNKWESPKAYVCGYGMKLL